MEDFAYTVKGRHPFPGDMLRRDGARAATPADQALIDRMSGFFAPEDVGDAEVEVNLVIPDAGTMRPNARRWESFGWTVPGDEVHAAHRRMAAEEAAREADEERLAREVLGRLTDEERQAVGRHFGRLYGL